MMFHIIGLGVSQTAELSTNALSALQEADVVLGSARQLAVIEHVLTQQETQHFPTFSELPEWISQQQKNGHNHIAILGSGDPLYFGIGRWFSEHFPKEQLRFYSAVSSIQAACHKTGVSLQDANVISLHGRPVETLHKHLKQHQTLVILTDEKSRPAVLAQICKEKGFVDATLTVCEKLGYADESVNSFELSNEALYQTNFDPLHVTIIKTGPSSHFSAEFPGIPDTEFFTDGIPGKGMLTKREVRLAILSLLQPTRGDVIWDIGAGCGSVAVELALWQEQHKVLAIEHHSERLKCLFQNREKFGVLKQLEIVPGRAPNALEGLDKPNKVFIGGSDGELNTLLKNCWERLPEQGVLVASAVTENTRHTLIDFSMEREHLDDSYFESVQLMVGRADQLAGQLLYRPNLPVTLFKWVKAAKKV